MSFLMWNKQEPFNKIVSFKGAIIPASSFPPLAIYSQTKTDGAEQRPISQCVADARYASVAFIAARCAQRRKSSGTPDYYQVMEQQPHTAP